MHCRTSRISADASCFLWHICRLQNGASLHQPTLYMAIEHCHDILVQRPCTHACCRSAGLVSATFGCIAQSCISFEGTCPATQPIILPVNELMAADSAEPPGWLPDQMVFLPVSILSCRTGLARAPMRQLSIHASAGSLRPPNFTPGVPLLGRLARAAAAQMQLGLQDSLASCKSASTALVPIPTSLVTADPVSASQAKAGGSMHALRQAVADMRAESQAQSAKVQNDHDCAL